MPLETIVAPSALLAIGTLIRVARPWWRRHVQLRGEIGVTVKLGDPDPRE